MKFHRFALIIVAMLLMGQGTNIPITILPHGFYVATTGSDANPGTLDAPFATLTRAQTAMRGSSTKFTYVRSGHHIPALIPNCWWGSGAPLDKCVLQLTSADNGETWAGYPPDGCNTALIDGQSTAEGNGVSVIFSGFAAPNNFTVNCLTLENFQFSAFSLTSDFANAATSPTNVRITNNIIRHGTYKDDLGPQGGSGIQCYNCVNMLIDHNAISDFQVRGTSVQSAAGTDFSANISGLTITNNYVANTCKFVEDCGAIYQWDTNYSSSGIIIRNNYVEDGNQFVTDTGGSGIGSAIYFDDCFSNATVSGNVITGKSGGSTIQFHGGHNITFSGNIIDLTTFQRQLASFVGSSICHGFSGSPAPMDGNSYVGNIIISGGGGGGYFGGGSILPGASNQPTLGGTPANDYFNYAGAAISSLGVYDGSQLTVNDTNPQNVNPQLNCWAYNLAGGSPVFSAPINFPAQGANWGTPGFWGPPGFVVPQVGTPPSQPHAC